MIDTSKETDPAVEREYRQAITDQLGTDVWRRGDDPLIDLGEIAALAGVRKGTAVQWRQRSRRGELEEPLPAEAKDSPPGKPMWRAVSTVCPWLDETRRWPPMTAARPGVRKEAA